ncbi:TPA: SDR family oxidoreductase [Candidatus Poribacteria bacterium]|nr:SDR family oxidoreductase [Candidatus Poribacteria bacterium]HEX30464.1 SDR family oxidoreductase [Candidatus Poribacteria bacterium]
MSIHHFPRFLITGGAGFIGSNIVHTLVRKGEGVRVLDNLSTGNLDNLRDILGEIELIEGDIRDINTVGEAVKGVEVILHQAALPSVARSVENPIDTNDVNIRGTLNLLIAARDAGVKRVVYASSSSIYGDTPTLPKREDMPPNPISPYALTKYVGERYCQIFTWIYGLETVSLRYFNVFGPRQNPHSQYAAVIPIFIRAYLTDTPPTIFGDGEQSRDFTYIENVVQANLLAAEAEGVAGEVFNIACGSRTTVNELARIIAEIVGSDVKPVHGPPRPGDVRHSQADISKAKRMLGYEPSVSLIEGLKRTVEWYRKAQSSKS